MENTRRTIRRRAHDVVHEPNWASRDRSTRQGLSPLISRAAGYRSQESGARSQNESCKICRADRWNENKIPVTLGITGSHIMPS